MPVAPIVVASIIGAGAGVAQSVIQSRAAGKAANQQTASGNQALDLQRQVLSQQQQNIAPFLQAGGGSLARLNEMLGRQGQSLSGVGMQGNAPAADPNAPVRVKAPDGRIVMVPRERIKDAIANGGTPLDQGFEGFTGTPGVQQVPMNLSGGKPRTIHEMALARIEAKKNEPRRLSYREYKAQQQATKPSTGLGSL